MIIQLIILLYQADFQCKLQHIIVNYSRFYVEKVFEVVTDQVLHAAHVAPGDQIEHFDMVRHLFHIRIVADNLACRHCFEYETDAQIHLLLEFE
ncbi:hypothetical protein SDC9_201632 [bioreactor metagenome]|uniref:Uncharacterized protein n=1 Tax=bioreactor metagenome TaxID=1076179 RepID=A0A645J3B7_9ZZZZ